MEYLSEDCMSFESFDDMDLSEGNVKEKLKKAMGFVSDNRGKLIGLASSGLIGAGMGYGVKKGRLDPYLGLASSITMGAGAGIIGRAADANRRGDTGGWTKKKN